jgi:hypothetical protein
MGIFNLKRVEELERELRGFKRENEDLRRSLQHAEGHIRALVEIKDNIPEDCTPGSYCAGCNFVQEYYYHNYVSGRLPSPCYSSHIDGFVCGKANVCKNFIQKEIKE